jgi:hypothetical protein
MGRFGLARMRCLALGLVGALAVGISGTATGQSPTASMIVAPVTIPGFGGPGPSPCGTNPAYLQPVLRFTFTGTGPLTALSSIPPCPDSLVNDPVYAIFNSQGELFVSNRHGNQSGGIGSIARFTFDSAGNFFANGSITGNSLGAVHGLAFSPTGELFAANLLNGTISRFRFDAAGNALPNGTIATGFFPPQNQNQGLASARNGELFVTHSNSVVQRFLFDPVTGAPVPNGTFSVPGSVALHGLTFNVRGELFVADAGGSVVYRFLFDSAGNPVGNGAISVSSGVLGVAFSSAGELFVTNQGISRFLFDASGNAIPNGFIVTPPLGGVAIFPQQFAFAAFSAKVDISLSTGSFDTNSTFTLGAGSRGINPLTQPVTLKVGPFSTTIPAGSFQQNPQGFVFGGVINGVALEVIIVPQSGNSFAFKVDAAGVSNLPTTNPVTVGLTVGNNVGTTTVTADFH